MKKKIPHKLHLLVVLVLSSFLTIGCKSESTKGGTDTTTCSSTYSSSRFDNLAKCSIPRDDLAVALESGNSSLVDSTTLFNAAMAEAQTSMDSCNSTLEFIYPNGLEQVAFPGTRVDYFKSTSPNNIPLHAANNSGSHRIYSWVGEKYQGSRYAVLGANVFAFDSADGYSDINNDLNQELKNSTMQLLKWLLKRGQNHDLLNESLTILVYKNSMKNDLEEWLTDNSFSSNWDITTDTALLTSGSFDLYIAKEYDNLGYKTATEKQKPVIVFKDWIKPDSTMLSWFGLEWSWYGGGKSIGDWGSIKKMCEQTVDAGKMVSALTNLKNETLSFNHTDTACPTSVGKTTCNENLLKDDNGKTLAEQLGNGAQAVRNQLKELDRQGVSVFSKNSDWKLLKLIVLLGDKLRGQIQYPMDKKTTGGGKFYKAWFADHTVHYSRYNNPYQKDLGDFSSNPATLNGKDSVEKTVSLTPTAYSEWTTTGLYALPGKTVTVQRSDDSTNDVSIKFNMLRVDTTRMWDQNKYSRPRFMQSHTVLIEKGKEYKLSTPYGGPIYVYSTGVATGASSFSIKFSGVQEHPTLTDFSTTAIDQFKQTLENTPFDWVDIKTPYVEIHSLKSKMKTAFESYNGDVKTFMDEINNYLIINNLSYAGFAGSGLTSLNSEVQSFCTNRNLNCTDSAIHKKPKVQHINSDMNAHCGGLCSGNPFDTSGSIKPLGWGESHELGHNLQRSRLKIYGGKSGEVSNNIFPIHVNMIYAKDQNLSEHPSITRPNHEEAFAILQQAIAANTAATEADHPLWSESGTYTKAFERLAFYIQLVYVNESWDIYTKLYLMERIYSNAIDNDTNWSNAKDDLGFSSYSRTEAKDINGNDFMVVALSLISGKDHSDYFKAWGVAVSDKAKTQITTNGFTGTVPKVFYRVPNNKLTVAMPTTTLSLDGSTTWD